MMPFGAAGVKGLLETDGVLVEFIDYVRAPVSGLPGHLTTIETVGVLSTMSDGRAVSVRKRAAGALRRAARLLDPPPPEPGPEQKAAKRAAAGKEEADRQAARQAADREGANLPASWFTESAPGSRPASMFFDKYPRFYETSQTTATRGRLNLRYEAIFAENRDVFAGAKVLDIASHDGRWSLAALECGAASVIGIEARPDLVAHSVQTLGQYGWGPDRCTFVAADIFEALADESFDVDVVMCLGFLYHTLRFNELLHGIRAANPRHVIIDTISPVMLRPSPLMFVKTELHEKERNAVSDEYTDGDSVLVGQPNLKAMAQMASAYDFEVESVSDWPGLLRDNPDLVALGDVPDYVRGQRTTIRWRDRRRVSPGE